MPRLRFTTATLFVAVTVIAIDLSVCTNRSETSPEDEARLVLIENPDLIVPAIQNPGD
ncbi:MAG: hypothetical protein AAF456_17495 [Planctomycetota bacterium]